MQYGDLEMMTPEQYMKRISSFTLTEVKAVSVREHSLLLRALKSPLRTTLFTSASSGTSRLYRPCYIRSYLLHFVPYSADLVRNDSLRCSRVGSADGEVRGLSFSAGHCVV
jgi:hypothetical protein